MANPTKRNHRVAGIGITASILVGGAIGFTLDQFVKNSDIGASARNTLHGESQATVAKIRLAREAGRVAGDSVGDSIGISDSEPEARIKPRTRDSSIAAGCVLSGDFSLDRLARAVARHETANCTTGIGPQTNNCFGIRDFTTDWFKFYDTPEDSYKDFKRIWSTYYKGFPTVKMAEKWSGKDRVDAWMCNVEKFYKNS